MTAQHPYESGYSVLPNLRKIAVEEVFHRDDLLRQTCLREKQEAIESQTCLVRDRFAADAEGSISSWITESYPVEIRGQSLNVLAPQMSEDVVVHRLGDASDAMVFGHVCFPSGWDPANAIGKSFEEIHQPVPGMNLNPSRKLVETIVNHGPFERFVWSVIFQEAINGHPNRRRAKFDQHRPMVFVKVERQVTVPFAELNCALFLLQQSLIPDSEIKKAALAKAIRNMSADELKYKNLDKCQDELCHWLESSGDSDG